MAVTAVCRAILLGLFLLLVPVLGAAEIPELDELLASGEVVFYNDATMPPAYQHDGGIHSPMYNISGEARESAKGHGNGGNGNREFPWRNPGGTTKTMNVFTSKFYHLPRDDNGNPYPIVWWRVGGVYNWMYPHGTLFGEELYTRLAGEKTLFEVRTRLRTQGDWETTRYVPFSDLKELRDALDELGYDMPETLPSNSLKVASRHPVKAFNKTVSYTTLPRIPEEIAKQLLDNAIFEPEVDCSWTSTVDSIVPAGYQGYLVADNCKSCHEHTTVHVNAFDFNRDWYGRVRGGDGIFTLHIFHPRCISHNGFTRRVVLNSSLPLEQFDHRRHTGDRYSQLARSPLPRARRVIQRQLFVQGPACAT